MSPGQRIGLVGCGNWGRHILRDLVSLGCEVTVVARSASSVERARQGGAAQVVASVAELPEIAGAVVAVPTRGHAAVVHSLLPRGIPIFVEKPLTADVATAEEIAATAGDRVFVMDKWRYHPGVQALAELVTSGELGALLAVETIRIGWGNPHSDVDGVWHLAPHDLAIVGHIMGSRPAPRAARADRCEGIACGLVGLLGDGPWAKVEVHTRSTRRARRVDVRFEAGVASLSDGYADCIEVLVGYPLRDTPPAPQRRPVATDLPLLLELQAFIGHLGGGPPPMSSAAEGVEVCRAIDGLRRLAGL